MQKPLIIGSFHYNMHKIRLGAESTNYPLLCAASTFITAPLIIMYFFVQKQIMESYAHTGLKE